MLDGSATRRIMREPGRQPEVTRAFFEPYASPLFFGTGQAALDEADVLLDGFQFGDALLDRFSFGTQVL